MRIPGLRLSGLAVLVFILLVDVAGWYAFNRPQKAPSWGRTIDGVAYAPFRDGQSPNGKHPTKAEVAADMAVLAKHVRQIRTYSSTDGSQYVPALAAQYGMHVMAGAWIDGRRENNEKEIAGVIAEARNNPDVTRILVGNESILRGDISVGDLINYIRRVRTQVKVPVSTAEPWHVWLAHPELGREVDFIAIHILPYWEGLPASQAVDYVLDRYQQVKDAFPTKPVVITEVGWPSDGRMRRDAVPSLTNEGRFIRDFLNAANRRGLDYFLEEAFDQPWKRGIEGSVGSYWGVWNADRQLKFPLTGPLVPVPDWRILAGLSLGLAFLPLVWFLVRWRDLRPAGKIFFGGLIQVTSSTLVWTFYVGTTRYLDVGTAIMWVSLVPLLVLLLIMLLAEGLEVAEVIWQTRFKRRFVPFAPDRDHVRAQPKVSLHLPICNEPPEMVIETISSLARLDYENFEVLVIDNNTRDPAVWRPVEAHCAKLGEKFRFFHIDQLKGFKAGALNFALDHTAADAEVVGVIDADYIVTPDWLSALTPYFERPEVAFVQAPQDHYDWRGNAFKEMINWEYAGFFNIGMIQRNEHNAIIQHGTMTLIRRSALQEVDRWAEWCICEDAELGLRLFEAGYQSVYVNRRFGYGLTPDSFTSYKKQRFRWAYGAVQILKRHWREMLPGRKSRLTPAQRYHFVAGWMPWFADAAGLLFSLAAVVWTIGVLALPRYFEFPLTLFLIPTIGVFVIKVLQFLWLYKARVDCTLGQRIGAGIAGLALTFTVGQAMLYGLFTSKLPFMRTPKHDDQPAVVKVFAMAWEETLLFILLWLSALSVWSVFGVEDPEAKLWAIVMMAQSLPCAAAMVTAAVNVLGGIKLGKIAGHGALPTVPAAE